MADIDAVIRKCVDDIWAEYDKDGSGQLDRDETKKFVQNTLSEMNDSGEFSEADFDACFKEFDKDGSGTIEKDEMAIFIKKVAGLWTCQHVCIKKENQSCDANLLRPKVSTLIQMFNGSLAPLLCVLIC